MNFQYSIIKKALLITAFFLANYAFAQETKLEIKNADVLRGSIIDGMIVDRLVGNAIMQQGTATIYCDSAQFYRGSNRVEAFGHVRIVDDSVTITANQGSYNGDDKIAKLRGDVVFRKRDGITLYTDILNYNRNTRVSTYYDGGRLVDGQNVLKSKRGYYSEGSRMASFGENVEGNNPDWSLTSDTLQYNTYTKIIYFRSTTQLEDSEGKSAVYETGFYDTVNKRSSLRNGQFETPSYFLEGMDIELDDEKQFYTAEGEVYMVSKGENVIITGESAVYDKARGRTKIYDEPLMKRIMSEGDTLYLRADTLYSVETEEDGEILYAYNNVFIYKTDFQGKADSLAYHSKDSMMYIFNDPVLWTQGSQMTSDTMKVMIKDGQIDKLIMTSNSFIISKDSLRQFNQIKGRRMTTFFKEEEIQKVDVSGNGESIYYVVDDEENSLTGLNKVICSNMLIRFKENMVNKITFYVKADGDFIPPHEITRSNSFLKGYVWRETEKPEKSFVMRKVEASPIPDTENEVDKNE